MRTLISRLYDRHLRAQNGQDSFPTQQLFVLALCRICEPIAFMSIFPYAYRMIETFNLTQDETKISIYAGALITAFAFSEFTTGVIWGRISDRIGRKPVLIMGLVGTALSMICFGFARNFWTAILARALGGLLNGNVGVLQTTVAELITKKEHQPRAYSIMPFIWCLGSIIGPAMGGALATPCEAYPWLFPKGGLFDVYPFLLPNLVCVVILILGITIGILFLEETHVDKKHRRDRGRELGHQLLKSFFGCEQSSTPGPQLANEFDRKDLLPGYGDAIDASKVSLTPSDSEQLDVESHSEKVNKGAVKTFNRQVVLVIVGYAILAYHSVSFDSLMPTFLSEDRISSKAESWFKFAGGFGMSTKTIGFMMAVQGIYSMVAQLWLFPFVVRRMGTLQTFRLVLAVWPLLYLGVPYLVLLPDHLQRLGIYICLLTKITFHVIAFPSTAILLANAAHSKSVLGTVNGVASSAACLARAFGPTITGSIHAFGLKHGYNGPAWWFSGIVCALGAIEAFMMEETETDKSKFSPNEDEQPACEPLLHANLEHTEELHRCESISHFDDTETHVTKA